jgi:hypothetical protein
MKLVRLSLAALVLFVVSCSNEASDNNSTSQGTSDTTTTAPATPPQEYSAPPSKADAKDAVEADTSKTSISLGKDGASVKTKKGTGVSYDKKGVKVESKDVKVDIKRDSL